MAEYIITLQTLSFDHPQILIMFVIIFNIFKCIDYITGQLLFHYIPYNFKETTLYLIILPQFIQQLMDTFLINILWYTTKMNYIIPNEQIIHTMNNLVNINYAWTSIYVFYIVVLFKK